MELKNSGRKSEVVVISKNLDSRILLYMIPNSALSTEMAYKCTSHNSVSRATGLATILHVRPANTQISLLKDFTVCP